MPREPQTQPDSRKPVSRRLFLGGAGLMLTAAVGGVLYRAVDNGVFSVGEGAAYAPWADLDQRTGTSLDLIRYAILASNPHNVQPWLFHVTDNHIDLYVDSSRKITHVDPYLRELYAGCGCALTNLLVAAPALGYRVELALMPDDDETHVASLALTPAEAVGSLLLDVIPRRHTDRYAYQEGRSIPSETLTELSHLSDDYPAATIIWVTEADAMARLGELMIEATEAIIADEEQSESSFYWQRSSREDIQRQRDGITIDAAGLDDATVILAKLLPPSSREQSDSYWLTSVRDRQVPTASAFGILALENVDSAEQRIQGGMIWQALHLHLTARGLSAQPMNQIPERIQREQMTGLTPYFQEAVAGFLAHGTQPLILFRAGYPTHATRPSPRRDSAELLLTT